MDLLQFVNDRGDTLEMGDVVVISTEQPSDPLSAYETPLPEVNVTEQAYNTRVCGIVSQVQVELLFPSVGEEKEDQKGQKVVSSKTAKGTRTSKSTKTVKCTMSEMAQVDRTRVQPGHIGLLATHGAFAHCKVDADIAPIKVGDLLTTSHTKGHAQKVIDPGKAVGAIVGKALGNLKKGKGKIPVLVMLQ